jgi:hypothetical protein
MKGTAEGCKSFQSAGSSVRLTKPPFELGPKHALGQSIIVLDFQRNLVKKQHIDRKHMSRNRMAFFASTMARVSHGCDDPAMTSSSESLVPVTALWTAADGIADSHHRYWLKALLF